MNIDERNYSLAVFVDYENLALGTGTRDPKGYQKRGPLPQMDLVFERLVEKGRINVKRAYCDWQRFSSAVTPLHELGIELIEIPDRIRTGKNSADIRLAVDAMEVCFTKDHLDTFVICSGDSDFSPLVAKLKEHGKRVIGVGMRQATSSLLVANCDEFIFYEDIALGAQIPEFKGLIDPEKEEAYRLLFNTIDALNRENVERPQASLVKDTIRRKRPDFNESNYGYRNFTALLEEASRLGFIVTTFDDKSGTWCVNGFSATPPELPKQKYSSRYDRSRYERKSRRTYSADSTVHVELEDALEQEQLVQDGQPEESCESASQPEQLSVAVMEAPAYFETDKDAEQGENDKLWDSMLDRVVAAFEQQDRENRSRKKQEQKEAAEEKKPVKKRGRPAKKKTVAEPVSEETAQTVLEEDKSSKDDKKAAEIVEVKPEISEPKPAPKRRGRPRKVVQEQKLDIPPSESNKGAEIEAEPSVREVQEDKPVKKKRGRPRKNLSAQGEA